jgi:hypothetical protein
MGNIGDPMTSGTIPAVGTAGTGYASTINAFLTEVKQRLEAKVPLSSVLISTLDMANNAIQNVSTLSLYPQSSTPSAPTNSLQSFGGNLYWVSTSGAVKITDGTTINAAGIGGITGDYGGSNPAQFRFVDASQTYFAYDDFGAGAWARLQGLTMDIAGGATSLVRIRLAWAGAGSYTWTFPASLPATQKLLQISAAGAVTASGVLATDESITLSGTGRVLTGNRSVACGFELVSSVSGGTLGVSHPSDLPTWTTSGASVTFYVAIPPIESNSRLISVTLQYDNSASGDPTSVTLMATVGLTTLNVTSFPKTNNFTTNGAFRHMTMTVNTPAINFGSYFLKIVSSAAGVQNFYRIDVVYDTV